MELEQKKKLLKEVELEAQRTGINFRIRELKLEISGLFNKETRMWFQRSKALWASHGNKNSKYFHSQATQEEKFNLEIKEE